MLSNWSENLRSDLDKLAQFSKAKPVSEFVRLKEGERRVMTILFLDIQGFTAMSEQLDPEDVQYIIDYSFKILTNEIEKYHGYIDKYEGDRLMALFGNKQATEKDCECALRAALGMQEKFKDINQILTEKNLSVGMRIGVNAGLVVTGRIGKGREKDFTVMGDAVNLASRLESNAPKNQIMISEEVKRIASGQFKYENLGEITVKGKAQPIQVFCVKGLNQDQKKRWERSPFSRRAEFVGRDDELAALTSSFESAMKEGFKVVGVSAQAGTGKSRLFHEFENATGERGHSLFVAHSMAAGTHQNSYGVISDLIRNVDQKMPVPSFIDDERTQKVLHLLMGQSAVELGLDSLEPEALRTEIHLAMRHFFEGLVATIQLEGEQKLLVHLEDLQWADPASLEALSFLFENLERSLPFFGVFAFRPEFDPKQLNIEPSKWKSLDLRPLTKKDCISVLQGVLGKLEFPSKDIEFLVTRSGGNPFFLEELIHRLIEEEVIVEEGDRWIRKKPLEQVYLPDSVQRIIVSRIDRLGPSEKTLLMTASVMGEVLDVSVLEKVSKNIDIMGDEFASSLNKLLELGFIEKNQTNDQTQCSYHFRHGLTQSVSYSMILNHNKNIFHGLVAKVIEAHDRSQVDLLFYHYSKTDQVEKIFDYGFQSLSEMYRHHSAKEGLEVCKLLNAYLAKNQSQLNRYFECKEFEARFCDFLGLRDQQLECVGALMSLAENSEESQLNARAMLQKSLHLVSVGQFKEAEALSREAIECMGEQEDTQKTLMELYKTIGVAAYNQGENERAKSFYEKGLSLSKSLDDKAYEATFYNTIGLVHFNSGNAEEALKYYEKAYALMVSTGNTRGESIVRGNQGLIYWSLGHYSKSLEYLSESHAVFSNLGFKKGQAATLGNIGVIYHKLGLYTDAVDCYQKALDHRRSIGDRAGEGFDLVNLGVAHTHLGEYETAQKYLDQSLKLAKETGSQYLIAENLNSLSIVYRKKSESDPKWVKPAIESASEALEIADDHQLIPAKVKALSNLGRAHWINGDLKQALELSDQAMNWIETNPSGVEGAEEDAYVNHYYLLKESKQEDKALAYLEKLIHLIQDRVSYLDNEEHVSSFVDNVRQNRFAIREWKNYHPNWNL